MFGSKPNPAPSTPSSPTPAAPTPRPAPTPVPAPARTESRPAAAKPGAVLSQGVSIDGDVKFGSALVIDGEVKGTITSKGELTIGEHGRIKAEIRAGSVTIYGSVEGNVFATERCAVEAGGSLRGDVESPRLGLNENASFSGSAKISSNRS